MRPTTRIARVTLLIAAGAVMISSMAVAHPRSWLVSAFATAAPQQASRLSFDVQFPAAALGKPYMQSMRAFGGAGGYTFAEGGTPPPGMQWVPAGGGLLLRGTPTQAGDYALRIIVNDSLGQQVTKDATFHVTPNDTGATVPVMLTESITTTDTINFPISISPGTIPSAEDGYAYAGVTFTADGGNGNINLSSSNTLPTGMSFVSGSGGSLSLTGTPTQTGTFSITIVALDTAGDTASKTYSLPVAPAPALAVNQLTPPESYLVGVTADIEFSFSGGSGSGSIAQTGGSPPPGLSFSGSGTNHMTLSGTTTKPGNYTFTLTATDAHIPNDTASQSFTVNVILPHYVLTPGSFDTAVSGQSFSQTFTIQGTPAGYTLTMTNSAALPTGLTYQASGESVAITGIPPTVNAVTVYGPFSFNLTDQYGNVETLGPITLAVEPAPVATLAVTTMPSAPVYTDQVTLNFAATGNYPSLPTGTIIATVDSTAAATLGYGSGGLAGTLTNGAASIPLGRQTPGTHTVIYTYSGDSVYPGTGASLAGQNPATTATYTFTVAYPQYYLTGTTFLLPVTGSYDAIDASDNVYIANTGSNTISRYDTSGNLAVVPTTGLNQPRGMVFDGSGNLYIADSQNNRIVELAPNGTQTVLPMGGYTLSYPSALAMDATYQNLWIVDQNNGRVLDYDLAGQNIVAGNTVTGFSNNPVAVAVAKNGVVYAGSQDSYGPGGFYSFTPGSAQPTQFTNLPFSGGVKSLAFDRSGTLYAFATDDTLYRVEATGAATEVASSLNDSTEMAINSQGTILLTAQSYGDLAEFTPGPAANAGLSVSSEGYTGTPPGGGFTMYFHSPAGTTLTSTGVPANSVYLRPSINSASNSFASVGVARGPNYPGLQRSSLTATFSDGNTLKVPLYGSAYNTELGISPGVVSQDTTSATNSTTSYGGMTVDQNSNVYFTDTAANKVYEIFQGIVTPIGFTGLNAPTQVSVDGSGDVYVLDSGTNRILEYNNTGTLANNTTTVVFDLSTQSALASLTAFALDGAGNLYLAGANNNGRGNSYGNGRIQKLSSLGAYSTFSTGLVAVPTALAFDRNSLLYSGDGTGLLAQYTYTGAPGTLANGLGAITSMVVEPSGTVYATTSGGTNLSVVSPQGTVSSHSIAGVTNAAAVAEDGAGTLTVVDGATGQLYTEVRDAYQIYSSSNQGMDTNLNFPATVVGSASPVQSYTLTNTGTTEDAYGFNGLYLTNLPNRSDFPQNPSTTCTTSTDLAAGASCVLAYSFHPASTGFDSEGDNLDYSTTHPNNSYSTTAYPTFTGTGISQYGNITFSAAGATPFSACTGNCSLGLGSVGIGQSVTLTLTVNNTGGSALNIASIALSGSVAYSQTNNCSTALASLASCTVSLVFTPSAMGAVTGTLKFTSNSNGTPGSTQTVSLSGTGIAAAPYVFVANSGGSVSTLYNSNGSAHTSAVAGGGIGAAVDRNGLVFSITADGTGVSTFNEDGTPADTRTGQLTGAGALAIDGGDQLWIATTGGVSMGQILGQRQISYADPTLQKPSGVAIDLSGNVWIADGQSNTVHEIVGSGLPTAPLANAVTNKTPGTEPQ